MRSLGLLFVVFIVLALTLNRAAGDPSEPPKLTIKIENHPLRAALADIADLTHLHITVAEDVPDVKVTLNVREISAWVALRILVRQASASGMALTGVREGDAFVVKVSLKPIRGALDELSADARLAIPLALVLQKTPLCQAVAAVVTDTGVEVDLDKEVSALPITLKLERTTRATVLRRIFEEAQLDAPGLVFEEQFEGSYRISLTDARRQDPEALSRARAWRVTASIRDLPLREALGNVLRGSGYYYWVDPSYQNVRVSVEIRDCPLPDALGVVAASARERVPYLRFRVMDRIWLTERVRKFWPASPNDV